MSHKKNGPTGMEALQGIGEGLSQIFDSLKEAVEKGEAISSKDGIFEHTTEFGDQGSPLSGIAGMRVKVGVPGVQQETSDVVSRSKVKPAQKAPTQDIHSVKPEKHFETLEDENAFIIVAEMPGVSADNLNAEISGNTIIISTGPEQSDQQSVSLPDGIDPASLEVNLRNGILEVRLAKN